ncbi:Sphingosine N-acyltransferase lag1 [Vanrija pseudolonga]|uniref:Sphingosine N-acyltransferase lag1 n=1 Tax=Vanrija pseudolonga TaxID=143232 RepID=A0AAF0Y6K0_9TREE|nr:Sphingosine N-acyltransferase lag1 [Vanrija pseudolonga]
MTALIPRSLQPFCTLSYPVPANVDGRHVTLYDKGINDVYFVIGVAIGLTALRHLLMMWVFYPIGRLVVPLPALESHKGQSTSATVKQKRSQDRKHHHNLVRFAEQAWSLGYCTFTWTLSTIVLRSVPNYTSPEELWGTYPFFPIPALTKFVYLLQLGWWNHQIYVINAEKRRKDHWQMFGHHVLTIALMSTSYYGNFTRVGVLVHWLMDGADIFLPLAKILRYMDFATACDATFVMFLLVWVFSRQIGLFLVTRSAYVQAPKFLPFEHNPAKGYYFSRNAWIMFVCMLSLLLCLCTLWFYMAVMVAVRVVRGQGAADVRSDDEDDGEDDVPDDDSVDTPIRTPDTDSSVNALHNSFASQAATALKNGSDDVDLRKRR